MTSDLSTLSAAWIKAKEDERLATEYRRAIENRMLSLIGVPETLEGVETARPQGYTVKITGRCTYKVDGERLQELAAENGLSEHLSALCRWKPELNKRAWDAAAATITAPLASAITATPGRASFTITTAESTT